MTLRNTSGYVYAVQDRARNAVKIGWSKNPVERLQRLQAGNCGRLELILTFAGTPADEAMYHEAFARWRLEGEWFTIEGRVLDFLASTVGYIQEGDWDQDLAY